MSTSSVKRGAGDVIVAGPASWNTLIRVPQLPRGGAQTLVATGRRAGLGGTSAGKAVTLAALGVRTQLHTVLADDAEAAQIRAALTGVDLTVWPAVDGHSEQHLNLMADDGGRLSVYLEVPQAPPDAGPTPEQVAAADALVVDLAAWTPPLLAVARATGTLLCCDVHDDDGVAAFHRPWVEVADVLQVSADRLTDPVAYLRAAVDRGTRLAVCTRGEAGALACDATGFWEVDPTPASAVDSNGAGDAFFAGLLTGLLDGADIPTALAWASTAGAAAVSTPDLGAPTLDRATLRRTTTTARRV
ncbi:PfkB family carbohydrate kinase [Cellulomonas sp. NPDC089187]|uniref:carbohydrate kinase family protein n=1 Tax=Cellulomonas sp. NPDC089187 TaxID=3154970 RepID=UPI00342938BA